MDDRSEWERRLDALYVDNDETRLASAVAADLDAYGDEPGFEQAPERFARLERALDAAPGS